AKPSSEELNMVPHYFINNKHVGELFGAGHFAKEADTLIEALFELHDKIIVVGGSGLYINALLHGVDEFEEVPVSIRNGLNKTYQENGLAWLQNELLKADEKCFHSVDINNPQRMIRALEICHHSGIPYSDYLKKDVQRKKHQSISIFANIDRPMLYQRINSRVDEMMTNGLLKEVKSLMAFKDLNALKTVGYKELFEYLDGKFTLPEAVDKIKQHSRNYAKRQITWFKNKTDFKQFRPQELQEIIDYIDKSS
ncbi:MAG: tRNA (adenosine(37)-N6)-dimethylallyltransferase MiaA, partial [Bacteroidota bacterium]